MALALASQLGSKPAPFPGDHMGFESHADTFAATLHERSAANDRRLELSRIGGARARQSDFLERVAAVHEQAAPSSQRCRDRCEGRVGQLRVATIERTDPHRERQVLAALSGSERELLDASFPEFQALEGNVARGAATGRETRVSYRIGGAGGGPVWLSMAWDRLATTAGKKGVSMPIRTVAEVSGFRATSTHAQVMGFIEELQQLGSPLLHVSSFGETPQGRKLPLLVLSTEGAFEPAAARASERPVVMLQSCIHAGEVEGKESALMLVRDLV